MLHYTKTQHNGQGCRLSGKGNEKSCWQHVFKTWLNSVGGHNGLDRLLMVTGKINIHSTFGIINLHFPGMLVFNLPTHQIERFGNIWRKVNF